MCVRFTVKREHCSIREENGKCGDIELEPGNQGQQAKKLQKKRIHDMNGKQVERPKDEKHTATMLLAALAVYVLYYSRCVCVRSGCVDIQ